MEQFSRSSLIITEEKTKLLASKTVLICGIGGVGSYVVEALARMGIGHFILVDHDVVTLSNLNRQIIALHSTIGLPKVMVAKKRILDINPHALVDDYQTFINQTSFNTIPLINVDYMVDAIDTVSAKLMLVKKAKELNIPIISSMGTGNKLNPEALHIMDLAKTTYCPLAKVMRHELKQAGITHLKVLASNESPLPITNKDQPVIGSVSFVPSVGGLLIAKEVIKDLIAD